MIIPNARLVGGKRWMLLCQTVDRAEAPHEISRRDFYDIAAREQSPER